MLLKMHQEKKSLIVLVKQVWSWMGGCSIALECLMKCVCVRVCVCVCVCTAALFQST